MKKLLTLLLASLLLSAHAQAKEPVPYYFCDTCTDSKSVRSAAKDIASFQALDSDLTTLSSTFSAASSSGPAQILFHEDTDNGTNKVTLKPAAALGADRTLTIPDATGTIRHTGTVTQFIHPSVFRTSGYTNSASAGAHAPAADGTTAVVSRIQFVKDATNIIYTGFTWTPPKAWDPAAGVTLTLLGHKTATGTGTKVQFKVNALAFGDGDVNTATYSTTTTINVTPAANNTMKYSAAAITIDGSPAKSDIVYIQVARDSTTGNSANDDYDQTYSIFGATLTYSINAGDDS